MSYSFHEREFMEQFLEELARSLADALKDGDDEFKTEYSTEGGEHFISAVSVKDPAIRLSVGMSQAALDRAYQEFLKTGQV